MYVLFSFCTYLWVELLVLYELLFAIYDLNTQKILIVLKICTYYLFPIKISSFYPNTCFFLSNQINKIDIQLAQNSQSALSYVYIILSFTSHFPSPIYIIWCNSTLPPQFPPFFYVKIWEIFKWFACTILQVPRAVVMLSPSNALN